MPTLRRRNLLHQRRRPDEGDDDEMVGPEAEDDSQSDASAVTEAGNRLADASDHSDGERADAAANGSTSFHGAQSKGPRQWKRQSKGSKPLRHGRLAKAESTPSLRPESTSVGFDPTKNTEQRAANLQSKSQNNSPERIVLESRDTHNTRRGPGKDSEPRRDRGLQNPNRGGFFMHDHRHDSTGSSGAGRGRGRGRGAAVQHFPAESAPSAALALPEANGGRWDHDLHESVAHGAHGEPPNGAAQSQLDKGGANRAGGTPSLLSKSITIGTVTARVLLPLMKAPINFERMPVKQHTRLPDLRPPLRRDKPVRVSIPDQPPRYIFPSTERSFIFIPRAQRPNQQGSRFRRGGGYFSQAGSRRASVYGGSNYTPSVSMSRRSSFARDGLISPTGSVRPVVKLPMNATPWAAMSPMGSAPYGMPSQAVYRGAPHALPMHQPRPQKAVSVATIDSPQVDAYSAPQQQEQQPFHHQVPTHMSSATGSSHGRQVSVHSQRSTQTPLSLIPEQAVNAQPFQPMYAPGPYAAPVAPAGPGAYMGMYMYPVEPMHPAHAPYMMPMMPGPPAAAPGAMFEQGGTTFYYPDMSVAAPVDAHYAGGGGGSMGMAGGAGEGYYYGQTPMMYYPSA